MAESVKRQRIYAIDVLRGITVAAMIVVNNAGGKLSYGCLQHSEWNGMTLCDMVFPSFLFIVGMTAYISLSKTGFAWSTPQFAKILRRTVTIMLIGWVLHLIEMLLKGKGFNLPELRLTGVLPRIALCYFFVSVMALAFKRRTLYIITLALIVVYGCILLIGNGFSNDLTNILTRVDRAILGEGHLYTKRPVDPEGLLGTIGSIAHTLIGFAFGAILFDKRVSTGDKLLRMSVWGYGVLLAGLALTLLMPLNKRVWSPSFLLVSCGLVALTMVSISYVCDVNGRKSAFRVFDVFGVNPLFLYVLAELCTILMSATGGKHLVYDWLQTFITDPYLASAAYSLIFVAVMWLAGYPLYKKKIYIKI